MENCSISKKKIELLEEKYANRIEKIVLPNLIIFTFFPYNSEGVRDYTWGCAWRCIQSILYNLASNLEIAPLNTFTFKKMYNFFGRKEILIELYISSNFNKKTDFSKTLENSNFAPFDLSSGWAEPFIGQLCLSYFGIKSQLCCLNGVPEFHYAPQIILEEKIINFQEFKDLLLFYFSPEYRSSIPIHPEKFFKRIKEPFSCIFFKENEKKNEQNNEDNKFGALSYTTSIMLDDGFFAVLILFAQINNGELEIFIGDPHVKENSLEKACFYSVFLDDEGNKTRDSLSDIQKKHMYQKGSYEGLNFKEKKWMVLYLNKN